MEIRDLARIVEGRILTPGVDPTQRVIGGFGADLMSDVLTSIQPGTVLLTGLCNPQSIRTAQIADVPAIILVRGKEPTTVMVNLANQEGIALIVTRQGMFESCGRLYQAGLISRETT